MLSVDRFNFTRGMITDAKRLRRPYLSLKRLLPAEPC